MKYWRLIAAWLIMMVAAPCAAAVDVESFVRSDRFDTIKISPSGEYFAATMPVKDGHRTAVAIMRRPGNEVVATFVRGENTHIASFTWVNDERVVISAAEKFGALETPRLTGELYAISVDGSPAEILIGQRVQPRRTATRIKPKKVEQVVAFLVDDLPRDDQNVIISVSPFGGDVYTDAERLDVYSGRRVHLASAPVRNASFVTDNRGVVRLAVGAGTSNQQQLYYRGGKNQEWELLNDESVSGLRQWPIGFSADDKVAYLEVQRPEGPNAIVAFDIASRTSRQVLRGDTSDPRRILYRNGSAVPIGALFVDDKPHTEFFDDSSDGARLYRSLEAAFGGVPIRITSRSADGNLALVYTWSDRSPGDYYVFDVAGKKAEHFLSRRAWLDPAQMAGKRPIKVTARDGLVLHGYLTVPADSDGKALPMVVMAHGGPFGVRDTWAFDSEVQMLAAAGYAVLQVNFRGSGGYGKTFLEAGAREWGQAMQDDVTDATRWAIEQGVADPDRVCIYGASYGAYAALMGLVTTRDLYQCAVGYVGVYDLPMMHTQGDIQSRGSGQTYLDEWIGKPDEIAAVSPNRMADRITAPVFLAAGGEDERAPIQHSRKMERALRAAGVPVETLYYEDEGHGFHVEAHRREYYVRLLAFLARSLGGEVARSTAGGSTEVAE